MSNMDLVSVLRLGGCFFPPADLRGHSNFLILSDRSLKEVHPSGRLQQSFPVHSNTFRKP